MNIMPEKVPTGEDITTLSDLLRLTEIKCRHEKRPLSAATEDSNEKGTAALRKGL